MENPRILLVEDNPLMVDHNRKLFSILGDNCEILADAANLDELRTLLAEIGKGTIDVAVVDYNLENGECGDDAVPILRAHSPEVIVIGNGSMDEVVGADTNIHKGEPAQDMIDYVEQL